MAPTGLDHTDLGIGEEMDRALKQVPRWNQIRIENADELARGRFESDRERASFEAGAIDAMNQLDIETTLPQFPRARGGHFASIVGRIVQNLDLQQVSW